MASVNVSIVPSVSSVLIRDDNLEIYSLLWVDGSVNSNENCNAQQQLRSIINHIRVFKNSIECESYIRQLEDEQILLIVSGQLGSVIVPLIHSLRQVISIYVYCLNANKHQEWASKYNKIRAVVTDLNELIKKIQVDRKNREKSYNEPLPISIFNSMSNEERSSTNINGGFLHFQLLIDGLLRLRYSQTSRNEFINLCKREYKGNHQQLSMLQEFEKCYVPERALYWYTRHSFLYQMLNKALRIQNIDVLFLFRFFIRDLHEQLKNLQRKQYQRPTRVYRCQFMLEKELKILKESKGRLISMNSFLSTSLSRQKSLSFVSSGQHDDLCCVLFEIDIDPHLSYGTKPFANISSESQFENEQEILFMIATIFRLIDIRQEEEITVVQMDLCNENYNHNMNDLFEHMQKGNEEDDECVSIGNILRTAGMYDKAEQFYYRMLNELADDYPKIADLWGSIGLVKKAKGELELSFYWFNKSFKKCEQMRDHLGLARSLQNLADIHQMNGEFNQAINKYNHALNILQEIAGNKTNSVANCLNNLGIVYFEQRKFTEALHYYRNALDIRKAVLPHTHPDIAMTLNNIGNFCVVKGEYDQALQYFKQALNIYETSLPSEHPSVAQAYCNIGRVYCFKDDYQQSLVFLNRAAFIHRNILSRNHPDVHRCTEIINFVQQKQFQMEITINKSLGITQ